jgi:hypothetical protein
LHVDDLFVSTAKFLCVSDKAKLDWTKYGYPNDGAVKAFIRQVSHA